MVVSVWALIASVGWAVAVLNRPSAAPVVPSRESSDFERLRFIRDFADRLYTFQAASFRSTQTALAFLLADQQREEKLGEVERLASKIEKSGMSQVGRLHFLRALNGSGHYEAAIRIRLNDGRAETPLLAYTRFELKAFAPSAENPWGLKIDQLTQTVNADGGEGLKELSLDLSADGPGVTVQFPCLVENVELEKGTALRVRLSTFDVSELEITARGVADAGTALRTEERVRVLCSDRAFQFVTKLRDFKDGVGWPRLLFLSFRMNDGIDRKVLDRKPPRPRAKFEKTLEEQLGFVTE
ncbi:MAG: hypothetical protein IPJ84_13030 [Bdellovibrionales bacterium]|nr:hypothetical protein [Bdellovibrionales bacterium]